MANAYIRKYPDSNTDKTREMKHGGNSARQYVATKTSYFYEFLQILIFFLISCVRGNECGIGFHIIKGYTENHALGKKSRIKVNQLIYKFKSHLI